jgi:hypothetical protein
VFLYSPMDPPKELRLAKLLLFMGPLLAIFLTGGLCFPRGEAASGTFFASESSSDRLISVGTIFFHIFPLFSSFFPLASARKKSTGGEEGTDLGLNLPKSESFSPGSFSIWERALCT